ncbi:hypothetical protein AXG93_1451s1000 [Marchantia polymorpha subsp. ruderalis]|uniref:Uncharacterized protein n=1 Tax=Marchantia polymorpha subsp. ruderalis TaxID=1480154 RepID=A0A176VCA3_MARPO|nr:hypothetical protein AXG93_1451s1000 [Marchantia polymorpha subsp. ruderalis]
MVDRVVEGIARDVTEQELAASSRTKKSTGKIQSGGINASVVLCKQIETQKWLQLRDLERRVTAMIACSVDGQQQSTGKLNVFFSGLKLERTAVLRRLGLDRNLGGAVIAGAASVVPVCSSQHSE